MIQVLGLRHYGDGDKRKIRETFFAKGWRFNSIKEVFNQETLDGMLAKIPEGERYNLFYTVAECYEERGRKLKEQWAIPFDIDGMHFDDSDTQETIALRAKQLVYEAATSIGVDPTKVAIVFSGHGVQFFILLTKPIVDVGYFRVARDAYHKLTSMMQEALDAQQLQGHMDTSVWSEARLMRLPSTLNKKQGKAERHSFIIQSGEAIEFELADRVQATAAVAQQIDSGVIKSFPTPDKEAVCTGCKFLVHCKTKQAEIVEPQWYAALSILVHLPDGDKLAHEYSDEHPNYSQYEVDEKISQAREAAGPRTCKDIEQRWNGCHECDYYGKVTSPILIRGKDYIASKDFGFRQRKLVADATGAMKLVAGKPEYEDLLKQFRLEHPYKVVTDSDQVIVYNKTHWTYMHSRELKQWMTNRVKPEPSAAEMAEFVERLKSRNVVTLSELYSNRAGLMNFSNCVLDMRTNETFPHDEKYGFFDVRPYAYDPREVCPTWDKFILDIMSGDMSMAATLNEYAGYCISGDDYWLHKALILKGSGENGKSVFMEILGEVVGPDSHSTVPMQDLVKPTSRKLLENKLFNYSEETSINALQNSEVFKILSAGGSMSIKQLYVQEYSVMNRTKLILSCNTMPATSDLTHGFLRRLVIIPFEQRYHKGDPRRDPFLKIKLRKELSGICNRLMEAYNRLKSRGDFTATDRLDREVSEFIKSNDTINLFVNDAIVLVEENQDEHVTKVNDVYNAYVMMCMQYNLKAANIIWFVRRFNEITSREVIRVQQNNERYKAFKGVKLNRSY